MMKEEETPSATLPEASPEMNEQEQAKAPKSRRNLFLLASVAVIVLVLCIALPLGLKNKDNGSSTSRDEAAAAVVDNQQAGTTPGTSTSTEPGTHSGPSTTSPTTTASTETSRAEGEPTTIDGTTDGTASVSKLLGDGTLPLFGSGITAGYETMDELQSALVLAFRQQAQTIIDRNIRDYKQQKEWEEQYGQGGGWGGGEQTGAPMADAEFMMDEDMAVNGEAAAGGAAEPDRESGGVTDFETNNQEDKVDEADIIKADANYVYAAYGDYLVIWDTNGKQIAQVQMPPIVLPETPAPSSDLPPPPPPQNQAKSMISPDYGYKPKPTINSILLTDNHLVALVSGYNNEYFHGHPNVDPHPKRMLYGYRASQIRLYEKTPTGNLTFVSSKDVNGNFVDARSIGETVHLATSSSVDLWHHLGSPLDWWQIADGTEIDEVQYRTKAIAKADEIVPDAAKQLMDELRSDSGELPTLLQINQWFTQVNVTDDSEAASGGPGFALPHYQSYDVVSNVAQVTSFDVTEPLDATTEEITTSISAYLAPSYFDTLYGTEGHLVLATAGWDWNPFMDQGEQTTYLVALEIDGASTKFKSVGTLKGHLLNQYALDIVGDELRAATTLERMSWWWGPFNAPMLEDVARGGGRRKLQDPCPAIESDECMTEGNFAECTALVADGCESVQILESCPYQFACGDDFAGDDGAEAQTNEGFFPLPQAQAQTEPEEPEPEDESRTENYMVVLNLLGGGVGGQMSEKGRVQIGEKNEIITSVRFFDNVAYAVTFERTDPFYVLDMSVPAVLGELKIPGFSSYLHSMNADNTLLLAVGQNATDDGRQTGLMVSVFDATAPADPKLLVSHTFEQSDEAYSSSSVQWDYKAFRYVDGKLVIPMELWYQQEWDPQQMIWLPLPEGAENFRGFTVLDVNTTDIVESYRVSHTKGANTCRYCNGYLPQRSFVYNGDLMTIQENIVVSTGLHSGEEKWRFNLEIQGEVADCCW